MDSVSICDNTNPVVIQHLYLLNIYWEIFILELSRVPVPVRTKIL